MENIPANAADLTVIAILILSGILAFSRGLIRELLSVAGWLGAIFATIYGFAYVKPFARTYIETPILADAAAGIGLFILTLVLITLVSHFVTKRVHDSALGAIDHSLGFVYGVARGALIVILAYMLVSWVLPKEDQPEWLVSAHTIPMVEKSGNLLKELIPEDFLAQGEEASEEAEGEISRLVEEEVQRRLHELMSPRPQSQPSEDVEGYSDTQRRDMERLMQTRDLAPDPAPAPATDPAAAPGSP